MAQYFVVKTGGSFGTFLFGSIDFLSLLHEGIHEFLLRTYLIHLFYLYLFIFVFPHEGFFGALKPTSGSLDIMNIASQLGA